MWLSSLLLLVLAFAAPGDAAHLRLSGQHGLGSTSSGIHRRTPMTGTSSQLGDSQNMNYLVNATLNGKQVSIVIDTGSSDLWVSSPVSGAVPQNYQANVSYASGSASGEVMSATFDFAGFSIDSQFFIEAPDGDAAGGADGLIGLGPSSGSSIRVLGNSSAANPPLDRIFTSNSSTSPMIAILLQRSDDPDDRYPGDLAIGEVSTDYKDILDQPRLSVTLSPDQHWQTLLDVNGIIGPDGKPIEIKTQVTGAKTRNATVVFDTGFTFPQVPPSVAQALYGNISGAIFTNVSGIGEIWSLPCNEEVNATFLFGGVEFPIHPLDLNFEVPNSGNNGESTCVGAFQPYSFDITEDNETFFDMVLGMAFLRNSYLMINSGDMLDDATPSTDTAYIQLLPITNATEAAQDFAKARSGSADTSGGEGNQFSASRGSRSRYLKSSLWLIILVAAIGALLLVIACVACCCRRRRTNKTTLLPSTAWAGQSYRPIHEPSPHAAYDMHMAPGAPPGYAPQFVPGKMTSHAN